MSKRIKNSAVLLCLLFTVPSFGSNDVSLTGLAKNMTSQELIVEYKSYPSARRSDLVLHMLSRASSI